MLNTIFRVIFQVILGISLVLFVLVSMKSMSSWPSTLPMDDLFLACAKLANATASGPEIFDRYAHDLTDTNGKLYRLSSKDSGPEIYLQKYRNGTLMYESVNEAARHYYSKTADVAADLRHISRMYNFDDLRWMRHGLSDLKGALLNAPHKSYSQRPWSPSERALDQELKSHMLLLADQILIHDSVKKGDMSRTLRGVRWQTFWLLPTYRKALLDAIEYQQARCQDQLESAENIYKSYPGYYPGLERVFTFYKPKNRKTEAATGCVEQMTRLKESIPNLQSEAFDEHFKLLDDGISLVRRAHTNLIRWGTLEIISEEMVESRKKTVTDLLEKIKRPHVKPGASYVPRNYPGFLVAL